MPQGADPPQCCTWVAPTRRVPRAHRCGEVDASADDAAWLREATPPNQPMRVLRIRMNHGSAGFFAYVLFALNQLLFCRKHGLLPFVDFGRCAVNGHDHYASGGRNLYHAASHGSNMWDYYFEPVSAYRNGTPGYEIRALPSKMLWRLHHTNRKSIFAHYYGAFADKRHGGYDADWFRTMRYRAHSVLSQYVRVRRHIRDEVDGFWSAHMRDRPVLGVHVRGTDKQAEIAGDVVPPERYVPHIELFLALHPNASIFVATDSPAFLSWLRDRYPAQLVARSALRSERNAFLDSSLTNAYRKGEDVLIDALLLSRCTFLLKCSSAVGEFATYFNPDLHERSLDVQLESSGPSASTNHKVRGRDVPGPQAGALKLARVCTSSDVALSMLINTTDICSSFIRCPRPGQVEQRCRARPGAAWHRQVQGLYGAFREAYLTNLPPGPTSPDLSAARVAVRSVCAERMDLVVSHRCNEPVLAPLAQLLAQVPLGVCVRVLVLERCLALSGRTAYILPSMDARDQLFDVRRIAAPRAKGALEAYQRWAAGSKDTVSSVIFAPDAWHLQIQDVRSCATHLLSSSQRVGTELVTVQLGSLGVVHLAAAAVSVVTQAQIDAAMSASNLRTARVTRTRDYSKCQLGLLARLLSAAARAKTTARLEPAAVPRLGFHGEEQFALSCFDPDFMQNNRALLPLPAAQSRLWCDQNATADGASRFYSLVALTQQQGGSSHRAGAGTRHSAQSQQRCEPQQLLQTNLLPAGWFSTLHGLVKPLSHALRSGKTLITPAMQEFTTNDLCEGGRRDFGCFFRPLAPSCDQSVEAASAARLDLQDADFVRRESPSHAPVVPPMFETRGWFWWTAHLLRVLLQPAPALARAVSAALQATGLGVALLNGPVLGLHVRHGDACLAGERVRMARTCSPLLEYMQQAHSLIKALGVTTIYLATDSEQVLEDTRLFPEYRFLYLRNVSRFGVNAPAPTRLWDAVVRRRARRPILRRRNHQEAWMATIDALLLARCNAFVGKFTSTLFRTAYALHAAECECMVPFVSLDAPWCFDYGLRSGANWAFPLAAEDGTVQDNRFWC